MPLLVRNCRGHRLCSESDDTYHYCSTLYVIYLCHMCRFCYVLAVGLISCCNCHHFDSKKFALELFFIESYKLLLCFLFMNTFQNPHVYTNFNTFVDEKGVKESSVVLVSG